MSTGGHPAGWSVDAAEPAGGPAASVFEVSDPSQVGEVRRRADAMAAAAGLDETERGTLAIVVTEAATNLARHATGGRVLVTRIGDAGAAGIEVLALDTGPGIDNLGRAMEDGFSTAGTAGQGLGAIRRMATEFDVYSRAGSGTALVARVWSAAGARANAAAPGFRVGAVCVALGGEPVCGDAWVVLHQSDRTLVAVVDGLGHGPEAAVASSAAIRVVREAPDAPPGALVQAAHAALRPTRGAAMAVASIQPGRRTVTFAGIGNIAAAIHTNGGGSRSLASHNGTVGHMMRSVQEFATDWTGDATLVMHSDGVNTRWRMDAYPGLQRHDPALLAGVLYRDAGRGRDDATVVAVRERAG